MPMEPWVDAAFPLNGQELPLDHGYLLFSAVSGVLPALHAERGERLGGGDAPAAWALHPVRGLRLGETLRLDRSSLLKVRLPAHRIAEVLPLAGKTLEIGGKRVSVGVPRLFALEPKPALRARFVTIKHHEDDADDFLSAARQQLAAIDGLGQDPERLTLTIPRRAPPNEEQPRRRIMLVSGKKIVGFPLAVEGLEATASLALQIRGLGGRRHMGAGVFVPAGRE